jgi:urocanate hydratase
MTTTIEEARVIRSPRRTEISCLGWQREAARNWEYFDAIVATLRRPF